MSTKVKGLLKGLRYISQIFDEKEDQIEIGFPTDVKHVAHIGSDDPSANAPTWMNEYKSTNPSGGTGNSTEVHEEHKSKSSNSKEKPSKIRHLIPKSRHQSIDSETNPTSKKHTRRSHRSSDPSADSSTNDSSGGSRHRRHRRGSNHGPDSPSTDVPPTGKTHRRKSKNSDDGSGRKASSRRSSKGDSLTDSSFTEFGSGSVHESENGPK